MSSGIIWDLNDLVLSMPYKFVIENLLFFPTRIHLPYIKENFCNNNSSLKSIALEFVIQDTKAMGIFCTRSDLNRDIIELYPNIKWDIRWDKKSSEYEKYISSLLPSEINSIINYKPISFSTMDEDCVSFDSKLILKSMSLSDLRTPKGVKVLNAYIKDKELSLEKTSLEAISKMSDIKIYNKYSSLNNGMFFHEILPLSIDDAKRNPSFKFNLHIDFDLNDFYIFYKKKSEFENLPYLKDFICMVFVGVFGFNKNFNNRLLSAIFEIEMYLYKTCEDKSKYYNNFVESVKTFDWLKKFNISKPEINAFIQSFGFIFNNEAVNKSKYTSLDKIKF